MEISPQNNQNTKKPHHNLPRPRSFGYIYIYIYTRIQYNFHQFPGGFRSCSWLIEEYWGLGACKAIYFLTTLPGLRCLSSVIECIFLSFRCTSWPCLACAHRSRGLGAKQFTPWAPVAGFGLLWASKLSVKAKLFVPSVSWKGRNLTWSQHFISYVIYIYNGIEKTPRI